MYIEGNCHVAIFIRVLSDTLIFHLVYLRIASPDVRFACRTVPCKIAILERENSRGAAARRDYAVSRWPSSWNVKGKGAHCKIRKRAQNPANFQNSASYRFEFPWALLWDGPLYNSKSKVERKRERERKREKREDLSVAKLPSTSFTSSPSRRLTTPGKSRPPSVSLRGEAISPSTPVITSTNIQDIVFRDRALEVVENANSMESPS